jgi:phosphatidate cytidylyltransferase
MSEIWPWLVIGLTVSFYTLSGFILIAIENLAPWTLLNILSVLLFGLWTRQVFRLMNEHPGLAGIASFVLVVICVVTADTGAYFSGKVFGKRKLCPSISPNKTVEGLAGGVLLTVLLCTFIGPVLSGLSYTASLGLGILMAGTATTGDLIFSALKRYTGVKDSSKIIPGHGGILDRFDALFFSIPVAVLYFDILTFTA